MPITKEEYINRGVLSVSPDGQQLQIYTHKKGTHWIKPTTETGTGYIKFHWSYKGVYYCALAHRINWLFNVGEIPDGYDVDHIDNNQLNNDITNLQLLTHKENLRKSITERHNAKDANVYSGKTTEQLMLMLAYQFSDDCKLTKYNRNRKIKLIIEELHRRFN